MRVLSGLPGGAGAGRVVLFVRILRVVSIGVARGGPGVPVTPPPPFVSLLVSKQLTIFR